MVVLAVTWKANAGQEARVADIFRKLTESSRKEPGCQFYQVHRHREDPTRFFVYEQYRDDAAVEAHRATPYFQQYVRGELPKIGERLEANFYEPI